MSPWEPSSWALLLQTPVPPSWQWAGIIATFVGAALTIVAIIAAGKAAFRAGHARQAAERARQAAERTARVDELRDLCGDQMRDLQELVSADQDPSRIAAKCNLVLGRVVRFKAQNQPTLTPAEQEQLDLAREQLEKAGQAAANPQIKAETRQERLHLGVGKAVVALNTVAGLHTHGCEES